MAFFLKLKKADLQIICVELLFEFKKDDTRIQIKKNIVDSDDYEEGVIMELSIAIITD